MITETLFSVLQNNFLFKHPINVHDSAAELFATIPLNFLFFYTAPLLTLHTSNEDLSFHFLFEEFSNQSNVSLRLNLLLDQLVAFDDEDAFHFSAVDRGLLNFLALGRIFFRLTIDILWLLYLGRISAGASKMGCLCWSHIRAHSLSQLASELAGIRLSFD